MATGYDVCIVGAGLVGLATACAVSRDGALVDDFVIETVGQTINVLDAPSPGATGEPRHRPLHRRGGGTSISPVAHVGIV